MDALKLKIFDVLLDRITVSEFENWLYDSEEILENIKSNSLYFDVITINYRSRTWNTDLNNLVISSLGKNYYEILEIKKACSDIIESETFSEAHSVLNTLTQNFDFDTDYSILWKLYTLKDYFDLVSEGFCKVGTLLSEAKFYSKQTLKLIKTTQSFDKTKTTLESDLIPYVNRKL